MQPPESEREGTVPGQLLDKNTRLRPNHVIRKDEVVRFGRIAAMAASKEPQVSPSTRNWGVPGKEIPDSSRLTASDWILWEARGLHVVCEGDA